MKTQKGKFVGIPAGFAVTVPHTLKGRRRFEWNPNGLYITYDRFTAYIAYAGDKAGDSGLELRIPNDPQVLKDFAQKLIELANEKP